MAYKFKLLFPEMNAEAVKHFAREAWEGPTHAWVSEKGLVISAKRYPIAFDIRPAFVGDDGYGHIGEWWQVEQENGEPITAHMLVDPNVSPETAAALQELIRCAYKAVAEGKIGRKQGQDKH